MTMQKLDPVAGLVVRIRQWLDHPISTFWCVLSWLGSTAVFFGIAGALGGPTEGDAAESVYGTWAVAHGHLVCVYPQSASYHFSDLVKPYALTGPLYPLMSGAGAALLRIGRSVAFPTQSQLGSHCVNGFYAMYHWSVASSAILPTVRLSYMVWPFLLAGAIALIRASGRGRKGWEPMTLFLLALTPPVVMCITYFFHPQDLLAMGFILAGVACFMKNRWVLAGVLLGLAFCSQQFALLVVAPLFIVAPSGAKVRFAVGAIVSAAVIDVPLIVATSGHAVQTILFGSSRVGNSVRSTGGSVLWETDLRGPVLFVISRIAPIVVSMVFAWWLSRRLGPRLLKPAPLMSLVSTSLAIRLVFEENLFGYYFMALAVALVLLDVAGGRIRGSLLAWLALLTLAFNPVHAGFVSNLTTWAVQFRADVPVIFFVLALLSAIYDAFHRRFRVYKLIWIVIVALTCESRIWGSNLTVISVPNWFWQILFVSSGLALATSPLVALIKNHTKSETFLYH